MGREEIKTKYELRQAQQSVKVRNLFFLFTRQYKPFHVILIYGDFLREKKMNLEDVIINFEANLIRLKNIKRENSSDLTFLSF